MRAIEGIDEAAVLGEPDERTGERVVAYVVAAPGVEVDGPRLLAEAATSLAGFKLPTRIEVVAGLPHTVTGKVMKWRIKDGDHAGT